MKLAIFGATGATGLLLTERALAAGHSVAALVRNPAGYKYADRVRVVQGDAFTPSAIAATLEGADAVLSALGAASPFKPGEVLERGVPLMIEGMKWAGIRRIVVLGSSGALDSALDKQTAWRRWIIEHVIYVLLKYPNDSQKAQYAALSASGLDWTMAMPPKLTNGRAKGTYRIDPDALPRNGAMIARADVADWMMAQLTSDEWLRRGVYITW